MLGSKLDILKQEWIDVVFAGRNKNYGAYELRKKYNARLTKALGCTFGAGVVLFLSSFLISNGNTSGTFNPAKDTLRLVDITPPLEEPVVIIPPKPIEQPVATIDYATPVVVPDKDAREDERPPELSEIEHAVISTDTKSGIDDSVVHPPVEDVGLVVDAPKGKSEDSVFLKVEKEAEFPGGAGAWAKYVSREVNRNIDELQDDGRSGTVVVMFIVDREGAVSDVKALGCGESGVSNCLGAGTKLAEIAVNAIRKGPKWQAAFQNGKNVKAYRRQPVTFQLQEE